MRSEKQSRQDIIDKQLLQAGWKVGDSTQVVEEFEIDVDRQIAPNDSGALTTNEPNPSSPYKGHQYLQLPEKLAA